MLSDILHEDKFIEIINKINREYEFTSEISVRVHETFFRWNVKRNHRKVAELLLERGADVNAADTLFNTPLHLAALVDNQEVVKLLIERGADVNARNNRGWTPLHIAAYWNRKDIAKLLLENGANPTVGDSSGKTPKDAAIEAGNEEIAKLIESWQREFAKALISLYYKEKELKEEEIQNILERIRGREIEEEVTKLIKQEESMQQGKQ